MLFYFLNVFSLLLSIFFQFHIANELVSSQADFVFFNIGLCSVLISMSTAGLSGYLISSFTKSQSENNHVDLFAEKLSFFYYLFTPISLLVGIIAFYWSYFEITGISFEQVLVLSFTFGVLTFTTALNLLFQSFSYSIHKQVFYEVISCVTFCVLILFFIFFTNVNMLSLPLILLLRNFLTIAIFSFYNLKSKSYFTICFNKSVKVYLDVRFMIAGGAFYKSEPIIDRIMVSGTSGAITSLHLILQIYNSMLGVLYKVFTSPAIVIMTKEYVDKGKDGLYKETIRVLLKVTFFSLILICIVYFTPIVRFLLTFDLFIKLRAYSDVIYVLFAYFLVSLFGQIISNVFYILNNFKTPVLVSSVSFCFFIPIKIYFTYHYGLLALSWLIVAYHMTNTLILSIVIIRFFNVKSSSNY